MKVSHILIPTDLGPKNIPAYEWASQIAALAPAKPRISLIHFPIMPEPGGNFFTANDFAEGLFSRFFSQAEEAIEKIGQLEYFKGLKTTTEFVVLGHNDIAEGISGFLDRQPADIMILSPEGRGTGNLSGSKLGQIMRKTNVPALVTGEAIKPFKGRIAFPTDFSRPSALVFNQLNSLLQFSKATVIPFYVNTPSVFISHKEFRERSLKFARDTGMKGSSHIKLFNSHLLEEGILKFSGDNLCDWIAVAWQDKSDDPNSLFRDSVAEFLIRESTLPVLVMQAPVESRKS